MRRKMADVWRAVTEQRPTDVPEIDWKRSFDGVKAALKHVGFELVTTRDSFQNISIPLIKENCKNYSARKVIVTRAGRTSEPTMIHHLLTGYCSVLTDDERLATHQRVAAANAEQQPKGVATAHKAECRAVDELDALLGISASLHRQHLWEFRLADIAYCLKRCPDFGTNLAQAIWHGEQIKHAVAGQRGACVFSCAGTNMTVACMMSYLNAGLSLTCIGKSADDKVDVVWFFHGEEDIKMLRHFDLEQTFAPVLHLKIESIQQIHTGI